MIVSVAIAFICRQKHGTLMKAFANWRRNRILTGVCLIAIGLDCFWELSLFGMLLKGRDPGWWYPLCTIVTAAFSFLQIPAAFAL